MIYDLTLKNKDKSLTITGSNGTIIRFNVDSYSIDNLKPNIHNGTSEPITEILNNYLASVQQDNGAMVILTDTWEYYNAMLCRVNMVENTAVLMTKFVSLEMFRPEVVRAWVELNVNTPDSFKAEYDMDNPNHTREQTYVSSDYVDVVVLAIYMKALLPITALYLHNLSASYDKSTYELECLKIIPDLVKSLPGYIKLYRYTETFSNNKSMNHELLLKREISSEDRTDWLFSVLLIKRIVSGTVYNNAGTQTIVSYLYRQIKNKSDNINTAFNYKDKCVGAGDTSETADSSVLEKFRYKDRITVAEQTMLQVSITDQYLLPVIGDAIDVDEYKRASERFIKQAPTPTELQLSICKMTLMPYISHHALWLVTQEELLRKLMLSHMILRKKHPLIAILVIAYRGMDTVTHPYKRKNKLPNDLMEELNVTYPYRKVKGAVLSNTAKNTTLARTAIEDLCKDTIGWSVYLPENSSNELTEYVDDDAVSTPENVRELFGRFFLDLDTLTED